MVESYKDCNSLPDWGKKSLEWPEPPVAVKVRARALSIAKEIDYHSKLVMLVWR